MNNDQQSILAGAEALAIAHCQNHDPAHDIMHVRRVVANARMILGAEPSANPLVTLTAAWLHDIVQLPKGSGPKGESARRSAAVAVDWLREQSADEGTIRAISHAIEAHSFSGGLPPASIEAAIVQDADRLDALGAVGIARLWATAGVLNSKLHHPDDPAGDARALDDRAFGLDHIPAKLLRLPETMNTAYGREIARERAAYVEAFRERFLEELSGRL